MSAAPKDRSPERGDGSAPAAARTEAESVPAPDPGALARRAVLSPRSVTPADVLALQRTVGNRAVGQLLRAGAGPPVGAAPGIQRFYLETEAPPGYVWVDNKQWDAGLYEVSPNSQFLKGWFFRDLYRRRAAPPRPLEPAKVEAIKPLLVEDQKSRAEPDPVDVKQPEPPKEVLPTAKVQHDGTHFIITDATGTKRRLEYGAHRIAVGTDVTYKLVAKNQFLTVAQVVDAGDRPEARDLGGENQRNHDLRTQAILAQGLVTSATPVLLIGKLNESGARKHYADEDAVAASDREVEVLLQARFAQMKVSSMSDAKKDQFKIGLGGLNSIIGNLVYTSAAKTVVARVEVFHVGPSL